MLSTFLFTASFLAATAAAAPAFIVLPSKTLDKRAATQCGQWDTIVTGAYTLYADLWGEAAASSGSQCSTVESITGDTIAWSTSWSWAGGSSSVKSYTNAVISQSTGYQVSSISSIPSVWEYRYTGENIVADVSYDMFTSSTATGPHEYEIMIWLAALGGAGPISSTGSPVATPTINGISWKIFSGRNGDTTVYSFVAVSQVTSFSGDIKLFFTWLAANEGFSTSQYVTSIGAGTEPFTGTDAVLTVNAYSISFNLGGSSGTATVSLIPKVTTTSTAKATSTKCAKVTSTTAAAVASTPGASLYGQCGGIGWKGPKTCDSGTCTYSNAWYSQCLA